MRKVTGQDDIVEESPQRALEFLLHLGARLAHMIGLAAGRFVRKDPIVRALEFVLGLAARWRSARFFLFACAARFVSGGRRWRVAAFRVLAGA